MITEDQARMIGKAIRDEAGLIRVPIENEIERRAICIRLALDTKGVQFSLKDDAPAMAVAGEVLAVARMYDDFISGKAATEEASA